MKKVLLLILLLGVSIQGFSQSARYGVRGGYINSHLNFEETPDFENENRSSFYMGVFGDFKLTKKVSIVPEVQFSAEGANDENLHLEYIQAPILFKLELSPRFRIALGPQAGVKVYKEDDDALKNFAYAGVGGLEYKINAMLFIDLRYTYGISDVFDDDLELQANSTNIQFGVGYQF